jgi:DNA-binding transcriptional LysR family regulator
MGLWQLYVFVKVIELQSFSEAANACNLTQPTVSSHIKQLESQLECVLIDRIGKKAVATKVGKILYAYAKKLLALKKDAETAVSDFLGNMRGSVQVGGSTIPGVYILPGILANFRKLYPAITFSLDIDSTGMIIQKLNDGELELGIVGAKSDQKSIGQKRIIADEMMLVVPADHKWAKQDAISFETLKKEPFIKRECGSGTWKAFVHSLKKAGYDCDDLAIVAEIRHTSGVISAIKHQLGVSVLSPIAITDELKANRLKSLRIQAVDLRRDFYLTWNVNRSLSPITKLLMEFIETGRGLEPQK